MSQADVDYMVNYWHGWWRFIWHWSKEKSHWAWSYGICQQDDRAFLSLNLGRLTVMFSCESLVEIRVRYRKMFA